MPIPLSDGVHFVYVNSRGQASVHEGKYNGSSRRGYLGVPINPKEAGEEWLRKQGISGQGRGEFEVSSAEAQQALDRLLREAKEQLNAENKRLREELEASKAVERARGKCPFAVMLMKPTKDKKAINAQFRRLTKACHPDCGGDAEMFRRLTEAKERCLAWAKG